MKKLETFLHNIRHNDESMLAAKELAKDVADIVHSSARRNTKMHKLIRNGMTIYSTGLALNNIVNLARDLFTENAPRYTIEIVESDMLFGVVSGLVNNSEEVKAEYQPSIELRSRALDRYNSSKQELNIYKDHLIGGDVIRFDQEKAFVYAVPGSNNEKIVTIGNHKVHIIVKKPEKLMLVGGYQQDLPPTSSSKKLSQTTAIITCESEQARKDVMLFLRNNLSAVSKRSVVLYIARNWGSFSGNSDNPERPLSTVVLKKNQLENIVDELSTFIESEDKYNGLGVPYHHGILLSGPPGTGKSSTAKVVASHLGLDTYYIPLSSVNDNETFNELITEIKPRSVLLLEDIDTVTAAKSRKKKGEKGVTMEALLNVLDGVLSPHGVITIATTNHVENLDPAIIRPGRIDTIHTVDYLDNDQLERLCKKFISDESLIFPDITGLKISPADVIDKVKKHIDEPEEAWVEINKLIEKKIQKANKKKLEELIETDGISSKIS